MLDHLFVALMAQATPAPLQGEFYCNSFQVLDRVLRKDFGEEPRIIGRGNKNDSTMALYINVKTGSYTMVIVFPDRACILDVGKELTVINNGKDSI